MITVSIVSHGQASLLVNLIPELLSTKLVSKVILTFNIPEQHRYTSSEKLFIIDNLRPRGFAANQNSAFLHCKTPYFAVLNPDLEVSTRVWEPMVDIFKNVEVAMVVPRVLDRFGRLEDSWRKFPDILDVISRFTRVFFPKKSTDIVAVDSPEWAAGMFMLIRAQVYSAIRGFDERYFLYYEDVDLCKRLTTSGYCISFVDSVSIVHDAQRASHKNMRLFFTHVISAMRFLVLDRVFKNKSNTF